MSVWLVAGTRPEIVKLAPLYFALRPHYPTTWVATGQHTDLARQTLDSFDIRPDLDLSIERASSGVASTLAEIMLVLDGALARNPPRFVVVQGDTSSALAGALAGFGRRIPVGHVEAGLRTFDLDNPFPEEAWRTLIAQVASWHFAPTARAAGNLLSAGLPRDRVVITGNTVVDAMRYLSARLPAPTRAPSFRHILVTVHRRENWGEPLRRVAAALHRIVETFSDVRVEFVSHANPALAAEARAALGEDPRINILPPLDYDAFLMRMRRATLILSDSGGVQEEAPEFGVPVLVLRNVTERPEAVEAGVARLIGTQTEQIIASARELLSDARAYQRMARAAHPFGDGHAGERIAQIILDQIR
jgi:UDP-N-acetylglucosamine 2-epimerase (non-hydrolysing)